MRVLRGAPGINFGAQGSTGATGPEGPMGPTGPAGPQGIPGGVGNTGLTGPSGPTGPAGPQGIAGSQGPQGYVGETGPEGPAGPQGAVGPRGLTGAKGIQGDVGATGATGPPGPPGPSSVISAPSHYRVLSLVDVTQALNFRNFFSSTAIDGSRLLVFSTDPVARPTGNHEVVRCFARVSIRDNNGGNWVMRPAVLDMPGTSTTYVPQVIVEVPAFDTPSLGAFAANNIVVQAWWYFFVY